MRLFRAAAGAAVAALLALGACGSEPPEADASGVPSVAAAPTAAEGVGTPEAAAPAPSATGTPLPRRAAPPRPAPRPAPRPNAKTAADRHGWPAPIHVDDFDGDRISGEWHVYDGAGHAGQGRRLPGQARVSGGLLTITGTPGGDTAGMAWQHPYRYGRWETRARFPAGCACYHPVLILWPTADDWPEGGEVDYAEVFDARRQELNFFLHHGPDNTVISSSRRVDMTKWRTYAVEWTPTSMSGFIDGERFFHTTDVATLPPRTMRPTIQLDWFPRDTPDGSRTGSTLEVDWIRYHPMT